MTISEKMEKHHGDCIDMMGYKIYRDHTEVRRSIFLRARRAYLRLRKQVQRRMEKALDLAYRGISDYGMFKNSDSVQLQKEVWNRATDEIQRKGG